jgi:hypothetical protein
MHLFLCIYLSLNETNPPVGMDLPSPERIALVLLLPSGWLADLTHTSENRNLTSHNQVGHPQCVACSFNTHI